MDKIKILVADDHQIIIDGIKELLENEARFVVQGAVDKSAILEAMSSFAPDVLLLDIGFNIGFSNRNKEMENGLDIAEELLPIYKKTKILILTMSYEQSFVDKAIELGLSGYLLKNIGKLELIEAIETAFNGASFYSKDITKMLVEARTRSIRQKIEPQKPRLTDREIEVLKCLAEDMAAKQIADALGITENTVNAHKKSLIEKIGAQSSLGLVRYAVENGHILSKV